MMTVGSVPVAEFRRFADDGNRFEVVAGRGSLSVSITGSGPGPFVVDVQGRWDDAFEEEQAADAENAALIDPELLLRMCAEMGGRLTLTVTHATEASNCHWIRTTAALTHVLEAADWPAGLHRLLTGSQLTVVGDAGQARVRCGGFVIAGPRAAQLPSVGDPDTPVADRYEAALPQSDPRRGLSRPSQVAPIEAEGLEDVAALLAGAAASLAWLWLGSSASVGSGPPRVRFDGALPLEADFPAVRRQNAIADLALWRWAIRGDDTSRRDAAQQAVTLTVRDAPDLAGAAPRVLSAARFLHQASQRGLLAEALAARRSARDAATTAAETAADTARSVARSTFDRVLVQVAAAAGLLVAAQDGLLKKNVALALALAVGALLIGTAANAFLSDYKSARTALTAFSTDLTTYGDALTPEDIIEISQMSALADARDAIGRAKTATCWTLVVSGLVVAALLTATVVSAPSARTPASHSKTTPTSAPTARQDSRPSSWNVWQVKGCTPSRMPSTLSRFWMTRTNWTVSCARSTPSVSKM
jgi:hypothetical protein